MESTLADLASVHDGEAKRAQRSQQALQGLDGLVQSVNKKLPSS